MDPFVWVDPLVPVSSVAWSDYGMCVRLITPFYEAFLLSHAEGPVRQTGLDFAESVGTGLSIHVNKIHSEKYWTPTNLHVWEDQVESTFDTSIDALDPFLFLQGTLSGR